MAREEIGRENNGLRSSKNKRKEIIIKKKRSRRRKEDCKGEEYRKKTVMEEWNITIMAMKETTRRRWRCEGNWIMRGRRESGGN